MILDTSFLMDLLRSKNESAKSKAIELDQKLITKAVSSITVMELWNGTLKSSNSEREKKKVDELSSAGKIIEIEDMMIAATAISKNEPLLTRNVEHFKKIKNLNVENY